MKTLFPLLALVGLLTMAVGCSHTTKKYYEDDKRVDHHDYDHDRDHDDHRHDRDHH